MTLLGLVSIQVDKSSKIFLKDMVQYKHRSFHETAFLAEVLSLFKKEKEERIPFPCRLASTGFGLALMLCGLISNVQLDGDPSVDT